MKYSYFARQPILDQEKRTIGYELLFRDGPSNTFPNIDPDLATSRLLSDHMLTTHKETLGDKLGFINFPYASLVQQLPTLFSAENMVIEILEDCQPTPELLSAIRSLHEKGYTLALDDFIPNKEWREFLPYISIIKFDIHSVPIDKAKIYIDSLSNYNIEFLAEKIETHQEYQQALQAGFVYFQGYFFAKPEMVQKKALEPSFLTVIELLTEISKDQLDFKVLERLVSKDVTLSYKLLRYVNASAMVSTKIHSFKQALIYLGEDRLRKFISLVALSATHEGKPDHLYTLSIQRAKFCQLLSQKIRASNQPKMNHAFLTGMFSLLDSLLDRPLEDILHEIPIDDAIFQALTEKRGVLGGLLVLVSSYEKARWDKTASLSFKLKLSEHAVASAYQESILWTAELVDVQ
ncbi:hypothetical protein VII00023_19299 [Vibrio ichthyoenteri ATCC 700023]|uniref:Signal transduction protein n=1 Tax=Vibrio ichthyoenteri ATCC 700023 TaxID=870968 RepID=F9S390_9VIBR|nr:HDOD domain-containing protein [Vibrio ichthyoenteri]EGU38114.1 hypothetical protein VII00023_19299 [Vibrio ichthyoenteri ATCC 700023]